jgi:hypothetical protein
MCATLVTQRHTEPFQAVDQWVFHKQMVEWFSLPFSVLNTEGPQALPPDLRAFPALVFQMIATALLNLPAGPDPLFDSLKYAGSMTFEDLALDYSESGVAIISVLGKRQVSHTAVIAGFVRAAFLKYSGLVTEAWSVRPRRHSAREILCSDAGRFSFAWIIRHLMPAMVMLFLNNSLTSLQACNRIRDKRWAGMRTSPYQSGSQAKERQAGGCSKKSMGNTTKAENLDYSHELGCTHSYRPRSADEHRHEYQLYTASRRAYTRGSKQSTHNFAVRTRPPISFDEDTVGIPHHYGSERHNRAGKGWAVPKGL